MTAIPTAPGTESKYPIVREAVSGFGTMSFTRTDIREEVSDDEVNDDQLDSTLRNMVTRKVIEQAADGSYRIKPKP